MCANLPGDAFEALRYIQLPKKRQNAQDPKSGIVGCKIGRLVFHEGWENQVERTISELQGGAFQGQKLYAARIAN
eukprot:4404752-Alexandrium_andersonii.AAC.1